LGARSEMRLAWKANPAMTMSPAWSGVTADFLPDVVADSDEPTKDAPSTWIMVVMTSRVTKTK
jgi:hypothetical protein